MSVPSFSHPAGTLDPGIAKLTAAEAAFAALGYAIQKGDLKSVREMLEADEFNHQLLKTADYAGNTALVSDIRRTASLWYCLGQILPRGYSYRNHLFLLENMLFLLYRSTYSDLAPNP